MNNSNVWLITGAGRGMGVDIARAALAAGHRVVATGRNPKQVLDAVGAHDQLLALPLDVTDEQSALHAVDRAVDHFGRIDVLVNNAGSFQAGYFEELTPAQFRAQMETNFFGALAVTRAVLPALRAQRSGRIISISSTAGVAASPAGSAYSASKFALEGWMEALAAEVAPFGIQATIVEPGFFRTDLLAEGTSTFWGEVRIDDYAPASDEVKAFFRSMEGQQTGDPAKLANSLLALVELVEPPVRLPAGDDAVTQVSDKGRALIAQAEAHPELSQDLGLH